jgi:hypothetical protein
MACAATRFQTPASACQFQFMRCVGIEQFLIWCGVVSWRNARANDEVDLDVLRGDLIFGGIFAWECDGTTTERKRLQKGLKRWGTICAEWCAHTIRTSSLLRHDLACPADPCAQAVCVQPRRSTCNMPALRHACRAENLTFSKIWMATVSSAAV